MVTPRQPAGDIRSAIIDAAVRVVGEQGVDGLTHRAVARAADVSLSSTTYHFASKEAILAAALQHVADLDLARLHEATEILDAAVAAGGGAVTLDMLVDLLVREVTTGEPVRLRAQYHLQLEGAERPDLHAVVLAWSETVVQQTARVLAALGSPEPETDARLLTAAADGLRFRALTTPPETRPSLRPAVARLLALVTSLPDPGAVTGGRREES